MRPLLPTLKERKRYLVFEIVSNPIKFKIVSEAIWDGVLGYLGTKGTAQAGIWLLNDKYNNNKGIIRIGHKYVDDVKASLALIKKIDNTDVIVKSLGVSGILNKAEDYLKNWGGNNATTNATSINGIWSCYNDV